MKKLIASIVVLTLVFSSCNKYEEGSNYSLRSKLSRISGKWTEDKIIDSDGVETAGDPDSYVEFHERGVYFYKDKEYGTIYSGSWDFIEKNEKVEVKVKNALFTTETQFEIVKLKKGELALRDEKGFVVYYLPQ